MNDIRILRERQTLIRATSDRIAPFVEDGSVAILAKTTTVSVYPTVPGACYACVPLQVDGPEIEGAAASFTADPSRTLFAFNLGKAVPPVGTKLIATSCGGRWSFRYDG
jgi:hypothetical protein